MPDRRRYGVGGPSGSDRYRSNPNSRYDRYQSSNPRLNPPSRNAGGTGGKTVHVLYGGRVHYDALVPR